MTLTEDRPIFHQIAEQLEEAILSLSLIHI